MATLSAFTCFPDLPIELRLRIWKLACFQQRNIDVSFRDRGIVEAVGSSESSANTGDSLVTYTKPPPILHVDRQSRVEALKCYSLVDTSCSVSGGASKGSQFYINWQIDRLCFSSMIDLMAHEQDWDNSAKFLTVTKVREICLENGLRYLGWNMAGIQSLGTVETHRFRARQSTQVVRRLPWSAQIDDFVIFNNKGTEGSNSRGEIVEFGSAPLISRGRKTPLHGIDVTQGAGATFFGHFNLYLQWWHDCESLGQKTTMHAFEQGWWGQEKQAVHRVRLFH